eukprot:gene2065-3160_t
MTDTQLKRLTEDQKAATVKRLYDDVLKLREAKHETLVKKVYREEPSKTISTTQLQESVARQHDAEMERRKMKAEQLKQKFYAEAEPHKMGPAELAESVQRIYNDSVRHKQDGARKLDQKYTFKRPTQQKISPDTMKESASRLSKPKKTTYTDDEIDKVYGF